MNNQPMESSGITGTWINTKNGNVVHVRNMIIDGDTTVILTDEGIQIPGHEFSESWKQISDNNEDMPEIINQMKGKAVHTREPEFEVPTYATNKVSKPAKTPTTEVPVSDVILDKIFKDSQLTVRVEIDNLQILKEPLTTAVKYLDITIEQIADYIKRNIGINTENISKQVAEIISNQ